MHQLIKIIKTHNKLYIIVFVVLLTNLTNVFAIGKEEFIEYVPKQIQQINNGGKSSLLKLNNNMYEIYMDTSELEKGYYTTYIYENYKNEWTDYEGVKFEIDNMSNNSIKINLNINTKNRKLLSVPDNNIVMLKNNSSEELEAINPRYGTIEIVKGFNGEVYIPFNSLREKDSDVDEIIRISDIDSWGIVATAGENEKNKFFIGNFKLIKKGSNLKKYFEYNLDITGDKDVEIPVAGEGISNYKVIDKVGNENIVEKGTKVEFQLERYIDGADITKDGKLILNPDVEPQEIEIQAILDDSIAKTITVNLMKSWTLQATEVDGTSKSIPKENEVVSLLNYKDKLYINKFIVIVRFALSFIFIFFITLYWKWNKQLTEKEKNND